MSQSHQSTYRNLRRGLGNRQHSMHNMDTGHSITAMNNSHTHPQMSVELHRAASRESNVLPRLSDDQNRWQHRHCHRGSLAISFGKWRPSACPHCLIAASAAWSHPQYAPLVFWSHRNPGQRGARAHSPSPSGRTSHAVVVGQETLGRWTSESNTTQWLTFGR